MTTSKTPTTSFHLAVRWAARITSIPIIIVFLLMFIGEGFDPAKVGPIEWIMLLFGPIGLIVGMILGWWKEGLGGAVTILSFFASLLVGDYSGSGAAYMAVCAAPGFLFLFAWILSKPALLFKEEPAAEENLSQVPPGEKTGKEYKL